MQPQDTGQPMIRICITISAELLARLEQHRNFNKEQSLNDTIVEMMQLGMFDLEESDAHEPRH
jgi:hypothetical protein